MLLANEEEAIAHMGVCPALQEQFASKDQFTIPKGVKAKMSPEQRELYKGMK